MTKEQIEGLLGRTLSDSDFNKYKVAIVHLEDLLCSSLLGVTEERVYDVREGYSTVFTDLFRKVTSVKVRGSDLPANRYTAYQWDKRRGEWFNSIVLENVHGDEVAVTAEWGFAELPDDLIALLDNIVVQLGKKSNGNVKSKKIEDFTVTFSDIPAYEQFIIDNQATINKYSVCGMAEVQSGETCYGRV